VSWAAVLGLGAAAYMLKALGPVLLGEREIRPAVQTLASGHRLTVDARVPALAVAAVLVWRRAPFVVVVAAAAATAALLRALM
jgi:hypothetical protein